MNKYRPASIIIFVLAIFYSGCKKDGSTKQTIEETQIQSAKHYFNKDIAANAASYLIPTGDIAFNQKNPRKQLARKPLWEKASLIKLSFGMAVVVPVRYENPFIIKSNFGGNKFYMQKPIKLTTSGRGKLTTCFAGEDLYVQVC